jgi:hypothetical protein
MRVWYMLGAGKKLAGGFAMSCLFVYFSSAEARSQGSTLKRERIYSVLEAVNNAPHFDKYPPRLIRRPYTSIAACSTKVLLLAHWPRGL